MRLSFVSIVFLGLFAAIGLSACATKTEQPLPETSSDSDSSDMSY